MTDRYDLVVLGDANPDVILRGAPEHLTFGQAEREIEGATLTLGGSGALMAHAAARLGLRTAFVGLVGADRSGDLVLAMLTDGGVDISRVIRDPERATAMTVIFVRPDGDRAMLTAPGALSAFGPEHIDPGLLAGAAHVHVASPFLQPRLLAALPALLARAREHGGVTSLDTNDDPSGRWQIDLDALLPVVDYLLPNEREARALAFGSASGGDVAAAARRLASRGTAVVVKCGAAGALAARAGSAESPLLRASIPPVEGTAEIVVDTVGAGDTFDAGLVAGLARNLDLSGALRFAVAAGTLSVRRAGGADGQPAAADAAALAERAVVRAEE